MAACHARALDILAAMLASVQAASAKGLSAAAVGDGDDEDEELASQQQLQQADGAGEQCRADRALLHGRAPSL